ncbi:ArsR/SmtB family transcription factor [Thermodesulfobacteriota bacterium]
MIWDQQLDRLENIGYKYMNNCSYVGGVMVHDQLPVCQTTCLHPDKIARVQKQLSSPQEQADLAETFKVLGDYTRVRILQALAYEELCVCDLAALLELSHSAVSHQLRLLRTAKLVKPRKDGKMVFYRLDDAHVQSLLAQGLEHVLEG